MPTLWFGELAPRLKAAQRLHGRKGGALALSRFLGELRTVAMRHLSRYMAPDRAEDRVQDLLIAVAVHYRRIDPARCGSYFAAVAWNQVRLERLETTRPRSVLSSRSVPLHAAPELRQATAVVELVEAGEFHAAVAEACRRLPAPLREVALDVITNGETIAEAARRAKLRPSTVRSRLRRARGRLKRDPVLSPWLASVHRV